MMARRYGLSGLFTLVAVSSGGAGCKRNSDQQAPVGASSAPTPALSSAPVESPAPPKPTEKSPNAAAATTTSPDAAKDNPAAGSATSATDPWSASAPSASPPEAAWAKFTTVEAAQASFRAYFDKAYPGTLYAEAHDTSIGTSTSECQWETREAVQDSATGRWSGFVAGKFVGAATYQGITVQPKEVLTIFFQPDPAKKDGWVCDGTKSVAKPDSITLPSGREIHPPSQNGCFRIMLNCHGRNPTKAETDEALLPANTRKP